MFRDVTASSPTTGRVVVAGVVLGTGMGGFIDGIVFHQILQTHNMLSATVQRDSVVALEVNMFWDGLFHALTWSMTAAGIALLWRASSRAGDLPPTSIFIGSLLLGWGLFNFIEGTIDHHLLGVHHVIENADHFVPDMLFLASGLVLGLLGWQLIRPSKTLRVR
jgi:uncharacterized membrane protein